MKDLLRKGLGVHLVFRRDLRRVRGGLGTDSRSEHDSDVSCSRHEDIGDLELGSGTSVSFSDVGVSQRSDPVQSVTK